MELQGVFNTELSSPLYQSCIRAAILPSCGLLFVTFVIFVIFVVFVTFVIFVIS